MQKWEYKLYDGWLSQDEIQFFGDDGWELVATVVGMSNRHVTFYFKRPASN